jgi:hypothetical protein
VEPRRSSLCSPSTFSMVRALFSACTADMMYLNSVDFDSVIVEATTDPPYEKLRPEVTFNTKQWHLVPDLKGSEKT